MRRPPSTARVFSTGWTAVAPGGTGAPVMTWMALPGAIPCSGNCPARTWPITSRTTGAPLGSPARSA